MTIKNLKEIIANMPDNARIYLDDGYTFTEGNSEVINISYVANSRTGDMAILQTKNDIDVAEELEARFEYYSENDWDELDAVMDMLEDGYVLDDFRYDDDRYLWMKEFCENHGLV